MLTRTDVLSNQYTQVLIDIHYCQSKKCEYCSVSVTIWKSAYWGPVWKLLVVQQKIHLFSATNYAANLYVEEAIEL